MSKRPQSQAFSWQRLTLLILCVTLALILFVLIFATAYIHHLLSFITHDDNSLIDGTLSPSQMATATDPDYTIDPTSGSQSTNPSVPEKDIVLETLPYLSPDELRVDGIINIMLIGEDRRPGEDRQRSDSMILCSFDTNKNSITMTSFLRDTYVAIPGYNASKLNAPYQWGGVSLLSKTLAVNFGVHVDANVVVNFDGFISIINMLGGVTITLTEAEADHLNEIYAFDLEPGPQHLDGRQALCYSRIRKIDWDINRTQRQRNVLTAIMNNLRSQDMGSLISIATEILQSGFIETDMSATELIGYVRTLFPMLATANINNQHIPALGTFEDMSVGWLVDVKVADLEANRKILDKIFGRD